MYGLEQQMYDQLLKLRDFFNLHGIKAEFEAEGSSYRDLVRLRRLTAKAGISLFLKIGGVEAVRDIKDSLEIGVDGLIAPMVESSFGVEKFYKSYKKIYNDFKIHLAINIETRKAIETIDDILDYAMGKIDTITIGRSDLSGSYFDKRISPDSEFILNIIKEVAIKAKHRNLSVTVGGSINTNTIDILQKRDDIKSLVSKMETRKVILSTEVMLSTKDVLTKALKFEELYILSKKEFSDMFIGSEISRLTELQRRL
jgi:4-hydroxy-2-oxoheptanedioate aldolase